MTKMNKQCIFCGNKSSHEIKITAEHVLPKWMKKEIPSTKDGKYTSYYSDDNEVKQRNFEKKGQTAFDQTVNRICNECNNGWMSKLENEVKESLFGLIVGQPAPLFDEELHNLALWGVKTAIVRALVDAGDSLIPDSHYLSSKKGIIPKNIIVYIGNYKSEAMGLASRFAKGYTNDKSKFYFCSFFIYHLYTHVVYIEDDELFNVAGEINIEAMFNHGLIKAHPRESANKIIAPLNKEIDIDIKLMSGLVMNLLGEDIIMPPGKID